MKTVNDLKQEILETSSEIKKLDKSKNKKDASLRKRLSNKLSQLKFFLLYIDSSPTHEFCLKEVDRLYNRVNEIYKHYKPLDETRFKKSEISLHKKSFEKEWDLPKIKKQISAINYLLK